MNDKMRKTLEGIVPFLMVGIAIALIIGLFIMFSYVLVWGLIIGSLLWLVSFVSAYLFPRKTTAVKPVKKTKNRIIEHDDRE